MIYNKYGFIFYKLSDRSNVIMKKTEQYQIKYKRIKIAIRKNSSYCYRCTKYSMSVIVLNCSRLCGIAK